MTLPIYSIMTNSPAVHALLWDAQANRLRLWGDGYADESQVGPNPVTKPYAVFSIPDDTPEHGLTCQNLKNDMLYQFDVYGLTGAVVSAISTALQSALAVHGFTSTIRHPSFEPDVKLYRAGFDFSYISLEKKS